MTRFENVAVFKGEKVWLENSPSQRLRLFPHKEESIE